MQEKNANSLNKSTIKSVIYIKHTPFLGVFYCRFLVENAKTFPFYCPKIMATIKPVIVPAKALKGGKHKIRISVAHNGVTRYIVTNILIDSDKEFKNGVIVKRNDAAYKNTVLRNLLQQYQQVIDGISYINSLSCPELIYYIENYGKDKRKTIKEVYEEMISVSRVKDSTKMTYRTFYNNLDRYIDCNMFMEALSPAVVFKLDKSLFAKGGSPYSVRLTMMFLQHLYNYAKKCQYDVPNVSPFLAYKLPDTVVRDCWLTVEEIRRIRDCPITKRNVCKARDIFMLSYYLGGINIIDLVKVNFIECGTTLKYIRTKTETKKKANKYVEFDIPDEAYPIIKKYMSEDGHIYMSRKQHPRNFFTNNMPLLKQAVGIDKMVYYSARKSFAQHAFQLGVSEGVIDYILGHKIDKSGSSLYNYISVTPEQATDAVKKVLQNLRN